MKRFARPGWKVLMAVILLLQTTTTPAAPPHRGPVGGGSLSAQALALLPWAHGPSRRAQADGGPVRDAWSRILGEKPAPQRPIFSDRRQWVPLVVLFSIAGSIALAGCRTGKQSVDEKALDAAPLPRLSVWVPAFRDGALEALQRQAPRLDSAMLFAYQFAPDGHIVPAEGVDPIRGALRGAARPRELLLTVVNDVAGGKDKDPEIVHRVIATAPARRAHIAQLLAVVRAGGYDGLDVDYEGLDFTDRDNFRTFLEPPGR